MDPSLTYAAYLIAVCGAITAAIVTLTTRWLTSWLRRRLRSRVARWRHTPWARRGSWPEITPSELCFLLLYAGANACALGVGAEDRQDVERRLAVVAAVNLMIVFLGGRTNPFVDFFNVPLPSYYLAHHWAGRLAGLEAIAHGVLILQRQQNIDLVAITGYISAFSLVAIIILSVWWFRGRQGSWFGRIHLFLYLGVMAALACHVLKASVVGKSVVYASCGFWTVSHLFRLFRTMSRGVVTGRPLDAQEASCFTVTVDRPVRVFPSCYFYVYTPGRLPFYGLLHGQRLMLRSHDAAPTLRATNLTFLMSGQHQTSWLRSGSRVLLDGPYGAERELQNFETVILVAKGIGIVSLLPHAIDLARRRRHDDRVRDVQSRLRDSTEFVYRDATTRVDLIWYLEHNGQEAWVADQLKALQELDPLPENAFVTAWCVYPSKRGGRPPFEQSAYWRALDGLDAATFSRELRQETRYPGRSAVMTCGDLEFVKMVRTTVLESTDSTRDITFIQAEYRPRRMTAGLSARVTSGDSNVTLV